MNTINKQGIEDRITFIKLMIDLVNKKNRTRK